MNIEESIQQIETLIEAWQLDEADLNQTDINAMQVLLKENQAIKKKYENAVSDYETTMFEKEQLNSLVNSCQEEIRELKKQLEEYKLITIDYQELEARNQELMKENKKYKEVINKLSSQIKLYGKYNGEKCTRGFSMMTADFNKLLDILKGVE